MKRILITHTDLDGAACAIVFKKTYPSIEVRYCDYDTIDDVSKEIWNDRDSYDKIVFADITPNPEYGMKMIYDLRFIFVDHHITREYLGIMQYKHVVYDTNKCGALLSAEYLGMKDYNEFILAVDAYDRWQLESPYRDLGVDLNLLFSYYGMDNFVAKFANMGNMNNLDRIIVDVLKVMEEKYFVGKIKQGKVKFDSNGNVYFEVYVSERTFNLGVLVDREDFPKECKYIKTINLNDEVVGLYSNGFDVSEIAKANFGGGHRTASGYSIKKE